MIVFQYIFYYRYQLSYTNNYNSKAMKGKRKQLYQDMSNIRTEPYRMAYITQPVKSPSPDKKSANIIASTKSPQMSDIKRKITPNKRQYAYQNQYQYEDRQTQLQDKFTPTQNKSIGQAYQSTQQKDSISYMKSIDEYQNKLKMSQNKFSSPPFNTRARNMKIQIVADYAPQDFQLRQKSLDPKRESLRSNQVQYDQVIRQKDETIRELRQIIDMINKNNQNIDQGSYEDRHLNLSQQMKQEGESKAALLIENQKLLHIIQNNQIKINPTKEQILNREISQLKESLRDKEFQIEESAANLSKKIQYYKLENTELSNQNQKLIRLLKDRDNQERSKNDSLANSGLSQPSKSSDRQKITLVKIKEQHQGNLQLLKDNFYQDFQQLQIAFQNHRQEMEQKLQQMNSKLNNLKGLTNKLQGIQFDKTKKVVSRQDNHKQKERHQQIQSLLLQKYSKYEQQITDHKKRYQKLSQQLQKAYDYIKQLQNQLRVSSQGQIQFGSKRSQNYEAIDLVQNLMKQKQQLQHSLDSIQEENKHLRDEISIMQASKDREIKSNMSKLESSIMSQSVAKMQQDRRKYNQMIADLTEKSNYAEQRLMQATDAYEKDKIDTEGKVKQAIELFRKQNESFKASNVQKSKEIQLLREQNTRLKTQFITISSNKSEQSQNIKYLAEESDSLRTRCRNLEKKVGELNREIQQMDSHMKEQERRRQEIEEENNELKMQIDQKFSNSSQLQESFQQLSANLNHYKTLNIQLEQRLERMQNQLTNNESIHQQQITSLQQQISHKNRQIMLATEQLKTNEDRIKDKIQEVQKFYNLYEQLKRQRVSFHYETLEQQLKELKTMINNYELNKKSNSNSQTIEDYYRLEYEFQNKIQQNLKQFKDIERLKEQLMSQQKQKLLLGQKVSLLQKNIEIYERELKERKIMYEQVLNEKTRIQRQAYLTKKIRVEKNNIQQGYNSKITEINNRINRILNLERDRTQKWQQFQSQR